MDLFDFTKDDRFALVLSKRHKNSRSDHIISCCASVCTAEFSSSESQRQTVVLRQET